MLNTKMEHVSTFCATLLFSLGYFYQKRIIALKVLPNFGVFYQKFIPGCSMKLSPNLGTKIPL